jgi:hypothetical protein
MIPIFTPLEFEAAKSTQALPLRCKQCQGIFYRSKHQIQKALQPGAKDQKDFCSHVCHGLAFNLSVSVPCLHCGVGVSKKLSALKKSKHNFCSLSCAAKYHNSHKQTGYRRSKLEVWLENQLTQRHPDFQFVFNGTNAIDAELDIYIPALKLAFELNGIIHYEPIYGLDRLEKTQGNDHRKMFACAERGIDLCVLDTSHMKLFKEKGAQRYLDLIEEVLSKRLALCSLSVAKVDV